MSQLTAIQPLTWENEARPNGAINTIRPLTHSSDLTREGMAMQATRYQLNDPRLPQRFWDRVKLNPDTGCWQWQGPLWHGYGQTSFEGKNWRIHRLAYTVLDGPVPADLVIDHLCRNRGCCNPAHLEPVTSDENMRRGLVGGPLKATDVCRKGLHPWPESSFLRWDGTPACHPCTLEGKRRFDSQRIKCAFCGKDIRRGGYGRHRTRMHGGRKPA